MKFKKIFVLPLLAITLASCELIPLSTSVQDESITSASLDDTSAVPSDDTSAIGSEDSGASTSDDISMPSGGDTSDTGSEADSGKEPENNFREIDLLVLNGLLDIAQTDFSALTSLDVFVAADLDFTLGRYEFLEDDDFLTTIVELDGYTNFAARTKIADFDTADPKMFVGGNFDLDVAMGEEVLEGQGDLALYYRDEWMYGYADVTLNETLRDLLPLELPEGEQKLKQKVGAPTDDIDEFVPLDFDEFPTEEILEMMLHATEVEVEPHQMGTIVTYSIDFDFVIDLVLSMVTADIGDDLTSEEIDDLMDMVDDLIDELFDLNHAEILFLLDNDDVMIGMGLDIDVSLIIPEGDIMSAEEFDYTEYQRTEIALELGLELMFDINGDVTIDYPSDLGEYVEGVIIPN